MNKNRSLPGVPAGALVAALAVGLLTACSRPPAAPEPVRSVRTMVVAPAAAGGTHDYAAEVRARTESRLGFRVGGKMTRRIAEVGQHVRQGEVLALLDPEDLRLAQNAAVAATRAAEAAVEWAEADLKRSQDLQAQGFVSSAEVDRKQTALKGARAPLEQARAQAGVQGNQAAYSQLVAVAGGVVTAVEAEPGTVLAAGTPVLRLAHDGDRDAVFSVPEDALAGVRPLLGKPGALKVRLWGQGARTLPATVREIAAAADPVTRTFQVKADLGKADVQLGQTATALVDLPAQEGLAKLPLAAVTQQQGRTSVWLVDKASMTVKVQPIAVGGADGNSVVVIGGLAPGQVVVTAGVHTLTPGQKVRFFETPVASAN